MERSAPVMSLLICFFVLHSAGEVAGVLTGGSNVSRPLPVQSLCAQLVQPSGYPCSEHAVQTKDGYLLALQRVSSPTVNLGSQPGPPVLLLHGLFMAGDAWFLDNTEQSLGFILADHGFDVWVGNVRGTRWSHGHVTLSEKNKEFWDWSWQELALYDLAEMIHYIYTMTNTKTFVVGHSQGTIMALAAFTQPEIVEMVEAAALLCPISYLEHVSAQFVLRMVNMHLDQMILAMGIHQLNFRSNVGVYLLNSVCEGHFDCNDLLSSITGENCCFNNSRIDYYLGYEPHPSSSKNLHHLFQMIRAGTFAKYDYGIWRNLKHYGQVNPPRFDLNSIPKSLPIWMGYGGSDALADLTDFNHTLTELPSEPELLYLENYGHIDFLLSVNAKEDVYDNMIRFFRSRGKSSCSAGLCNI
ncbi:triacylglycerol lipase 1 [Vitis riparia]|uniref:triacylglycerol lipase 1 n=1 Tax=Vitis riparia TaxID=96939 RepID=UPI00155A33B8|nr:triacylglycerol lipase 1 [Vitis riparia]